MVDRKFVYTGALPQDTDVLTPQRNTGIGIGALAQAVIGPQAASPAFAVDGLVLAATSPASLVLNVGAGSVYAQGVVDATSYGSLAADLTDYTILQGISLAVVPLTFVPPATGGFAVNYLVQAGLSVLDTTPVTLPYYNASNPIVPWLGPNNSGVSQPTVRQTAAVISAKIGVAAAAGSQTTPSADPGYFGLYTVTVAQGATTLTSSNFSTVANAPFIPATLMAMPQAIQSSKWITAVDTGTANAMVAALSPVPLSLVKGMAFSVQKIASANTGAVTLNLNATGALSVTRIDGTVFTGAELPASGMISFIYDGTKFQVVSILPSAAGGPLFDGTATGTNAYTISNLTPTAAALTNRMIIKASFANANSAATTINIGFGVNAITYPNGVALSGGEITDQHLISYNSTRGSWDLLTPTSTLSIPNALVHYGADTSAVVNTVTSTMTPAITSYATGHIYVVTAVALTNTSGMTANFNGIGTRVISLADGLAIPANLIPATSTMILADNGTQLELCNVNQAMLPASTVVNFTTSTTWVVPVGVNLIKKIRLWGAGGAGGGARATTNTVAISQPGAGAGYAEKYNIQVTPTSNITVTVGVGGVGVVPASGNGGNGGSTSFGAFVSATGGGGGTSIVDGVVAGRNTAVGVGTGDFTVNGVAGGGSFRGNGNDAFTGAGGGAFCGASTPPSSVLGVAAAGIFPGGGGAAIPASTYYATYNFPGGNGAAGLIIIEY